MSSCTRSGSPDSVNAAIPRPTALVGGRLAAGSVRTCFVPLALALALVPLAVALAVPRHWQWSCGAVELARNVKELTGSSLANLNCIVGDAIFFYAQCIY